VQAMTEQTKGPLLPPADMTPWTKPPPAAPESARDIDDLLAGLGGGLTEAAIRRALKATGGNQAQAARKLRVSRDTLRWWMKKYGIESREDDE
jgi:DNA-binding NtrC family response regulator